MLGQSGVAGAQVALARKEFAELAAGWRAISAHSAPAARDAAEVQIFNQMVVALEGWFAQRPRSTDGSAMNEVRLLALGVTQGGVFPQDNTVRWRADASVTGYVPGDRIALTEEVFSRLAGVFLDGIARNHAA